MEELDEIQVAKTSFYIGVGVVFTPKEGFNWYSYPESILAEVPHYSESYQGLFDSQKILIINPLEKLPYLYFTGLTDSGLSFHYEYPYSRPGARLGTEWSVIEVQTDEVTMRLYREKIRAELLSLSIHPEVRNIITNSVECDVTFLCLHYQNPL
jgi:hypothetical protein